MEPERASRAPSRGRETSAGAHLVRALEPSRVSGRVIVILTLDYAAVMGGTRVSPIDGVNMNRALVDTLAVPVRGGGPAVDGEPEEVDPYAGGMTAGNGPE